MLKRDRNKEIKREREREREGGGSGISLKYINNGWHLRQGILFAS